MCKIPPARLRSCPPLNIWNIFPTHDFTTLKVNPVLLWSHCFLTSSSVSAEAEVKDFPQVLCLDLSCRLLCHDGAVPLPPPIPSASWGKSWKHQTLKQKNQGSLSRKSRPRFSQSKHFIALYSVTASRQAALIKVSFHLFFIMCTKRVTHTWTVQNQHYLHTIHTHTPLSRSGPDTHQSSGFWWGSFLMQ